MTIAPNKISAKARAMIASNPKVEIDMRAQWATVETKIAEHVEASKKKWKVYEAHHVTQSARLAMLTAFVEGKPPEQCAQVALISVGIKSEKIMNAKEAKERAALLKLGAINPQTGKLWSPNDTGLTAIQFEVARVLNADYFTCTRRPDVGKYEINRHIAFQAACNDAVSGDGRGLVYVVHTVNDARREAHLDRADWQLFAMLLEDAASKK